MDVYSELVEALGKCDAACNNCATTSLEEADCEPMSGCIKLNLHCAEVCQLALGLLLQHSEDSVSALKLCMIMCDECATECEKYEYDQCRLSAEACRRYVKQCSLYLEQIAEPESI